MPKHSKKTIALPISSFLPSLGGMEVGLHNIALKLIKKGYFPIVIAPKHHIKALQKKGWQLPYKTLAFPDKVFGILYRAPFIGQWILNRYLQYIQNKYEVYFWHGTMGYPIGCSLVSFAQAYSYNHYLIRCAGDDIQCDKDIGYGMRRDKKIDKMVRKFLPKAKHLIAITKSVADEYRKLDISEQQIFHIPNGVDLERFQKNIDRGHVRKQFNIPEEHFLFISVGRNHPKKNYPFLLKVVSLLKESDNYDFHLALIGKGVNELEELVKSYSLGSHVTLIEELGAEKSSPHSSLNFPSDELVNIYKAADAFVFPSLMETFGIAIVEAMAAELPVITTNAPGCNDVVGAGKYGLALDPRDHHGFVNSMKKIMSSSAYRDSLKKLAASRSEEFSWDSIVEKYIELYNSSPHHKK